MVGESPNNLSGTFNLGRFCAHKRYHPKRAKARYRTEHTSLSAVFFLYFFFLQKKGEVDSANASRTQALTLRGKKEGEKFIR